MGYFFLRHYLDAGGKPIAQASRNIEYIKMLKGNSRSYFRGLSTQRYRGTEKHRGMALLKSLCVTPKLCISVLKLKAINNVKYLNKKRPLWKQRSNQN